MDKDKAEQIGLMRYAIIAPAVTHAIPGDMPLAKFFLEASDKDYIGPDGNIRKYDEKTISRWYYSYRKEGFSALMPKTRRDCGTSRKIDSDIKYHIEYYKKRFPRIPATEILNRLISDGIVKEGDISLSTVTRCVNRLAEESKSQTNDEMRRYERPHINEVWCGDSCMGPKITIEGERKRLFVIALIDDSSRFVTGAMVSFNDNFISLMDVIKSATSKYGIPKIFNFDNGHSYKNKQMELLAARIGTSLHYCQPYSPEQKSKIERWFRTLRDKWMGITDFREFDSLKSIQQSLDSFVVKYNQTIHTSLNGKSPEERFFSESDLIHRLPNDLIDKYFLLEIKRRVSADCVIVINNTEYEVDSRYAGRSVCLRYTPSMDRIFLVESENDLVPIKLLNKIENSKVKRNKVYLSGGTD